LQKAYIIGLFPRLSEQKVAAMRAKDIMNRCTSLLSLFGNEQRRITTSPQMQGAKFEDLLFANSF